MSTARPPRDPARFAVPAALAAALAATGAVLAEGAQRPADAAQRSAAFQRLAGGLGTGSATDLARDPRAFDERLGHSTFRGDWLLRAAATGQAVERSDDE